MPNCRCAFNPTLTISEARQLVAEAKQQVVSLRKTLATLHEGNAHTVLGYLSWKAFVKAEFGHSLSWFYRQVRAWDIQADLEAVSSEPVNLSERALRELGKVESGIRQVVFQAARDTTNGKVTEAAIRHASEAVQEVFITGVYTDAEGNQMTTQDIISGDTVGRMAEARLRKMEHLCGNRQFWVRAQAANITNLYSEGGMVTVELTFNPIDFPPIIENNRPVQVSIWAIND